MMTIYGYLAWFVAYVSGLTVGATKFHGLYNFLIMLFGLVVYVYLLKGQQDAND